MSFSISSVWTRRRRVIVGVLSLVWLFIGGVFAMALTNNQTTEITYGTDEAAVTLRTDKSIAIAFLQCIHFSWEADNVELLETAEFGFLPSIQPQIGDKQACNSQEARVVAAFAAEEYIYPQTIWINPAALLFIGLTSVVAAIFFWRPVWIGSLTHAHTHLIFVLILIGVVLATQVVDPLDITLRLIPPQLVLVPVSGLTLVLIYLFRAQPGRLFVASCSLMLTASVLLAAYHLFTVPGMLNHDERYYASITATGAAGFGLYPYIQNYPPMPVMGGIGQLAWLYVAAYNLFGPTIWGMRLVVWLIYLLGLPAMFILFRRWYGTATAWLAVALIPTTYLYVISHSARMDAMTLTWIWWGLLLVDTARRKQTWGWHLAAGLFMGLGLQAHIDTSITTIACGILYLVDYVGECRRAKRFVWPRAVAAYSIGALMGLGFFVVANILPNPDAFLRTAGSAARLTVVEVDKGLSLPERVLRSFLALETFFQIAVQRVLYLFQYVPTIPFVLAIAAFVTLFTRRRSPADRTALILFVGVVIASFFILNGASPYYTMHLFPVTIICLPSFFTHGYLRRGTFLVSWRDVNVPLLLVLLPLVFPLYIAVSVVMPTAMQYDSYNAEVYTDEITYIHEQVSRECILMGPGSLYQVEFMAYPRYNTYTSEGGLALYYYEFTDSHDLWPLLNPDVVFGRQNTEFPDSLKDYIRMNNFKEAAPGIWQKTHAPLTPGCLITDENKTS